MKQWDSIRFETPALSIADLQGKVAMGSSRSERKLWWSIDNPTLTLPLVRGRNGRGKERKPIFSISQCRTVGLIFHYHSNKWGSTMKKHPLISCLVLTIIVSSQAIAASWKLDKAHSQVNFSVSHLVISEVTGAFKDFDVSLKADAGDFSDAVIESVIKTASVNTNNEARDAELRSDNFFNAEKFPEIRFKSISVEKAGSDTLKITGSLTIRDVTKTVVLNAHYKGSIKDPWGNTRAAFKASTTVNRFDYGVKWNATLETGEFVAGENVVITLLLEFVKE
jgi:polyisoprenoid-binding protein YceI